MATRALIAFDVIGTPAPQGSKRAFIVNGKPVITESTRNVKNWRQLVAHTAQDYAPATPLEGPVRVTLRFRLPVPKSAPKKRRLFAVKKPDLDKLARACCDAMTKVLWRDDSQIVELFLTKELAYDAAIGVSVSVAEVPHEIPTTVAVIRDLNEQVRLRLETQ